MSGDLVADTRALAADVMRLADRAAALTVDHEPLRAEAHRIRAMADDVEALESEAVEEGQRSLPSRSTTPPSAG